MSKVLLVFLLLTININFGQQVQKPYLDVFRKLLQPEKIKRPPPVTPEEKIKKRPVIIPALSIKLLGITGIEGARVAIISYKGDQTLIEEGDSKPGVYKVLQIDEDKVVFMHIKKKKRETSRIQ